VNWTTDRATEYPNLPAKRIKADEQLIAVKPARYVLLLLGHLVTGYSVKAMERKIERGDWIEGREWVRAPDGRVMLDTLGYEEWASSRYR
jgi:hypothetical protein